MDKLKSGSTNYLTNPALIVHPNFDPVAISIGPLSVHWYGLMYLCGFGFGLLLGRYRAGQPNSGWNKEEISDLLYYIAVGVIAGGRLGYVLFYNLSYYLTAPMEIFAIWDGGMSFHGGFLGVIVSVLLYARSTNRTFFTVADFFIPLVPAGLFFGRIGNFINQELWGRATDVPWAVLFHTAPDFPRHPSQLYEALLEGLLLFIIIWIYSNKPRIPGRISGVFILGYGMCRLFVEFFREPDGHIGMVALDWITMGQVLSVPMIILGLVLMFKKTEAVKI